MNRLLTEGRRAFLRRVSGIQRGAECARYEPLLSALADGEASAADLEVLRPHMRTCLSCRAALREFRAAPERVAGVLPPAALLTPDGGSSVRALAESALASAQQKVESMLGAAQTKSAAFGERLHAAAELATGQKLAAVAASAAALAGGGPALDELSNHSRPLERTSVQLERNEAVTDELPVEGPSIPAPPTDQLATQPQPEPEAPPPPTEPEPPPPPDPADEFAPSGAAPQAEPQPATAAPQSSGTGFAPSGGSGSGAAGGTGEFAP